MEATVLLTPRCHGCDADMSLTCLKFCLFVGPMGVGLSLAGRQHAHGEAGKRILFVRCCRGYLGGLYGPGWFGVHLEMGGM